MGKVTKRDVLDFMVNTARANSNCKKFSIIERRRWFTMLMVLTGVVPPMPVSLESNVRDDRNESPLEKHVQKVLKEKTGGDDASTGEHSPTAGTSE